MWMRPIGKRESGRWQKGETRSVRRQGEGEETVIP
jgi:hypothetical protein